ncbi:MAG: anhydro-N-acetylmuramic acid kinase [Pseudomonadota bacterium]
MAKIKTAIGFMSGTSMDGIDIALVKTDGIAHLEFGPTGEVPYDVHFAQKLHDALNLANKIDNRLARPDDLAALETEITTRHADALDGFLADNSLDHTDIDLVGFHGQTIVHRPDLGFTVQLGDGEMLANKVGIPVVWDMRSNDMENGGQGAPLAPVFHNALAKFSSAEQPQAFVNIGGIANVTFTSPDHAPIAFDCGPGNALIDQWMQTKTNQSFDEGGALALTGKADDNVVGRYLLDPFFQESIPKSLDRNDFTLSQLDVADNADGAATLAELTARAIALSRQWAREEPMRWIISGGGRHNLAIMEALKRLLPNAIVRGADEVGFNNDAMEAQCWGYLAVRAQRGLPLSFPSTTGCEEPCTGGVISTPKTA